MSSSACPKCGEMINSEQRSCYECGLELQVSSHFAPTCPWCHNLINEAKTHCGYYICPFCKGKIRVSVEIAYYTYPIDDAKRPGGMQE